MEPLTVSLDPAWTAGLFLAMTRVAAFGLATTILGTFMPIPARMMLGAGLGLFFTEPFLGSLAPLALLGAGLVNAIVGAALGWMATVMLQSFFVAGAWLDIQSGLFAAVMIDPTMGDRAGVYARFFNWIGFALFSVLGGWILLVRGLAFSFDVIALDGGLGFNPGALAETALDLIGRVMVAGMELALPVAAALFLVEVTLGMASRFSPQTNIFMLGLPLKLLVSLSLVSVTIMLFPEAMGGVLSISERAIGQTLEALLPAG